MAAFSSTALAKAAIAAVGTAVSAASAIQQGKQAKATANFEAEQLKQQGLRDRDIAVQEAGDFANEEARRRATLRARVGGSGATLEGSPLAVAEDLAGEAEFQKRRILSGGETAANRAFNQAGIRRFEGSNAERAGKLRGGASLLTGASKFGKDSTLSGLFGGKE